MADDRITLRSYRLAFELERRLQRIDRFRIPVPYGIPLVALAYGAAGELVVVVASGMPITGLVLGLVPWPMRLIMLPTLSAHLLCRMRPDGRRAHEALAARLLFLVRPRHLAGLQRTGGSGRQRLGDIVIVPDGEGPDYRRGRVRGPAHVILRQPARAAARRTALTIVQLADRPMFRARELRLREGQRLELR